MSGRRRLADLVALAVATRNVLAKSASIQLHNVTRAALTSSLTKAVIHNFPGTPLASSVRPPPTPSAPSPGEEDVLLEGKDQDLFYNRSDSHSSVPNPDRSHEFKVTQSDDAPTAAPLTKHPKQYHPNIASASKSAKPTSPIQDQFTRKYYTQHRPVPSETASDTTEKSPLRKNIDEEVYYGTKAPTSRNKEYEPDHIPTEAAEPPSPHDPLHDGLNTEYYYTPEADADPATAKKSVPHPNLPLA